MDCLPEFKCTKPHLFFLEHFTCSFQNIKFSSFHINFQKTDLLNIFIITILINRNGRYLDCIRRIDIYTVIFKWSCCHCIPTCVSFLIYIESNKTTFIVDCYVINFYIVSVEIPYCCRQSLKSTWRGLKGMDLTFGSCKVRKQQCELSNICSNIKNDITGMDMLEIKRMFVHFNLQRVYVIYFTSEIHTIVR